MTLPQNPFRQYTVMTMLFVDFLMTTVFWGVARQFSPNQVDLQVVCKLGLYAIISFYSALNYRLWVSKLLRFDSIFLLLLMVWMIISCSWSPIPGYSFAIAFTFWANIMLAYLACAVLSEKQMFGVLAAAGAAVSGASIFVYYFFPSIGRMHSFINGIEVVTTRMSGVTGTANGIGALSVFCCLLLICYWLYFERPMPRFFLVMFAINFIAQILSLSRSSVIAMILAMGAAVLTKATPLRLTALLLGICAILLIVPFINMDAFLATFSRSGDSSEILTATGRIFIWKQAIEMANLRPFTGYGYGSDGYLMPHFNHPAPHAHNMELQLLFTMGYVGLFFGMAAYLIKFFYAVKFRDQFKVTLIVCSVINGLTEPGAFHGPAGLGVLFLGMIMALPYRATFERKSIQPSAFPYKDHKTAESVS